MLKDILIKILCFLSNNIGTVATLISLVFVAIQTMTLKRTYKYNCAWQEKEKATELAQMYKNDILPSVNYIGSILKETGIMETLSNINVDNIDSFNQTELYRLTNRDIQDRIERKKDNFSAINILFVMRQRFSQICNKKIHSINPALIEKWIASESGAKDKDGKNISMKNEEKRALLDALWFEYSSIVADTLNDLEYFAMNFTSGVADDSVVFQSLHQSYLTLVQLLYYHIAIQNEHEKDKYYTNVIALYKKWRRTDEENEKKISNVIKNSSPVRK